MFSNFLEYVRRAIVELDSRRAGVGPWESDRSVSSAGLHNEENSDNYAGATPVGRANGNYSLVQRTSRGPAPTSNLVSVLVLKSINDAPYEVADSIREFWPTEEWDNAASVFFLESGWNPFAENDSTKRGTVPCGTVLYVRDGITVTAEDSIGVAQLNTCNFPTWDPRYFFNTRHNLGTAHLLWTQRGWEPWYFSAKQLGLI
jgi:hypothetical protein